MQGDGAGEEVAAARARNLQPEDGRPDARRLLGAPVTSEDCAPGTAARPRRPGGCRRASTAGWPTDAWWPSRAGRLHRPALRPVRGGARPLRNLCPARLDALRLHLRPGRPARLQSQPPRTRPGGPCHRQRPARGTGHHDRRPSPAAFPPAGPGRQGVDLRRRSKHHHLLHGGVRTTSPTNSAATGPARPASTAPYAGKRSSTAHPSAQSALPRKSWAT